MTAELDREVRLALFGLFAELERAPSVGEVQKRTGLPPDEVRSSYERLAAAHVIVLDPETGDVWMANPFSAVPTPYRVKAGGRSWYGNCIWDALGILAMLGAGGTVESDCPDCGEPLALDVRDSAVRGEGVAHFLVPAAHWWDDIGDPLRDGRGAPGRAGRLR